MNDIKKDEWVNEPVALGIIPGIKRDDAGDVAYWQNIYELRKAPAVCLQNRYFLSALKLIYSGIDNLAWLTRNHDRPDVEKPDFLDYVKEYLLPNSELALNADELYSARCGLIHCNIAESRLSRSGTTRKLCYKTGPSPKEEDYSHIRSESRNSVALVSIDDLFRAYNISIDKINSKIVQETDFSDLIYCRSAALYGILDQ